MKTVLRLFVVAIVAIVIVACSMTEHKSPTRVINPGTVSLENVRLHVVK